MTGLANHQRLSLGFVGDICLSLGVIDVVRNHGAEFVFARVRGEMFHQFNLTVGNLECFIAEDKAATRPSV